MAEIRILVVDDDTDVNEMVASCLEQVGFKTRSAFNGKEALELYKKHYGEIDVILTDIRMPHMSGDELLSAISTRRDELQPVLLCMSAFSDLTLDKAYKKGADALFAKPFDIDTVEAAIKHFTDFRQQKIEAITQQRKKASV